MYEYFYNVISFSKNNTFPPEKFFCFSFCSSVTNTYFCYDNKVLLFPSACVRTCLLWFFSSLFYHFSRLVFVLCYTAHMHFHAQRKPPVPMLIFDSHHTKHLSMTHWPTDISWQLACSLFICCKGVLGISPSWASNNMFAVRWHCIVLC